MDEDNNSSDSDTISAHSEADTCVILDLKSHNFESEPILAGKVANFIGHAEKEGKTRHESKTQKCKQITKSQSESGRKIVSDPPNLISASNDPSTLNNRIFIGGLDHTTTNTDPDILFKIFAHIGEILNYRIVKDRAGISKGYGFVTFKKEEDAEMAIFLYNNKLFLGGSERPLQISRAVCLGHGQGTIAASHPVKLCSNEKDKEEKKPTKITLPSHLCHDLINKTKNQASKLIIRHENDENSKNQDQQQEKTSLETKNAPILSQILSQQVRPFNKVYEEYSEVKNRLEMLELELGLLIIADRRDVVRREEEFMNEVD